MEEQRHRFFSGKISTTSLMKMYILHLLSQRNLYGNQIIDLIRERLNGKWEPSPGMIYPLLRDMEENGYVKSWWQQPDKKSIRFYKLTESGYSHLERLKIRYKKPLEDTKEVISSILEEIF